jgi:acyl-CoA thioesterase I
MWGQQSNPVLGTAWQTPYNAPALLQQNLQSYVGTCVTVANNAVSGTDLGNRLFGTGNDAGLAPPTYQAFLPTTSAQVVLENFALNDANPGNQWNEDPSTFQWYLVVFITETVKAGKIPALEEPNPTSIAAWNAVLPTYVNVIDNVAAQYNVPLVKQYDYISSLPNWQSMLIDGLHPTPALYELKASREATVVLPIVQALMGKS